MHSPEQRWAFAHARASFSRLPPAPPLLSSSVALSFFADGELAATLGAMLGLLHPIDDAASAARLEGQLPNNMCL